MCYYGQRYAVESRRAKWALRSEQCCQDHLHLLKVDERKCGELCWSVRLEMMENNCWREVPWVTIILFGESGYYSRIGGELVLPPDGYQMAVDWPAGRIVWL